MTLCWKPCPTSIVKPLSLVVFKVQYLVPLCQSPGDHFHLITVGLFNISGHIVVCFNINKHYDILSLLICHANHGVSQRGTSSVCWTCDFAQHFRKLYGDCPLSGSWLCCGRSWTQRGLSSQGGEVGVTSTAGWKDVTRGCYGHANHVVMQFVWNCILAQEGVIRVIWRQSDDYENHEAVANLAMFMPAMLFMKFLWKCNSAQEGVIRLYFEDNSIIMEIMKKREVVVITL